MLKNDISVKTEHGEISLGQHSLLPGKVTMTVTDWSGDTVAVHLTAAQVAELVAALNAHGA